MASHALRNLLHGEQLFRICIPRSDYSESFSSRHQLTHTDKSIADEHFELQTRPIWVGPTQILDFGATGSSAGADCPTSPKLTSLGKRSTKPRHASAGAKTFMLRAGHTCTPTGVRIRAIWSASSLTLIMSLRIEGAGTTDAPIGQASHSSRPSPTAFRSARRTQRASERTAADISSGDHPVIAATSGAADQHLAHCNLFKALLWVPTATLPRLRRVEVSEPISIPRSGGQ